MRRVEVVLQDRIEEGASARGGPRAATIAVIGATGAQGGASCGPSDAAMLDVAKFISPPMTPGEDAFDKVMKAVGTRRS